MTRLARGSFVALVLLAPIALTGCGPTRVPLQGSVTYDGKPIESGTVVFVPEDPKIAKPGAVITNGKYAFEPATAPTPGKYKVQITRNEKTGVKKPNGLGGTTEETKQTLPEKYNTKSELTYEVKADEKTKDFALTK